VSEEYQRLPKAERREALQAAALLSGRRTQLLEKDIWVVATLMLAERTFWEKATSMHVYCLQGRVRGERWSRHWHDLVRLDDAGIAARALADRELALSVARHKAMFFRENDSNRQRIDYHAAVSGNLRLVPAGRARATGNDSVRLLSFSMSGS